MHAWTSGITRMTRTTMLKLGLYCRKWRQPMWECSCHKQFHPSRLQTIQTFLTWVLKTSSTSTSRTPAWKQRNCQPSERKLLKLQHGRLGEFELQMTGDPAFLLHRTNVPLILTSAWKCTLQSMPLKTPDHTVWHLWSSQWGLGGVWPQPHVQGHTLII